MLVNIRFSFILIFIVFAFVFLSCNKKEDIISPEIIIEEPLSNSNYNLPVSIVVKGSVSDNNSIKNIKIGLVNENLSNVVPQINIDVNAKQYDFEKSIEINDRLIETGTYYISVKSFDHQNNLSSIYREIHLSEIPRFFKSFYIVSSENNSTNLLEIDTNGLAEIKFTLIGNFQNSSANSRHQYVFIGTDQYGTAFSCDNYNEIWNVNPHFSPYPFFTGAYQTSLGDQLHLVFGDGLINTYNKSGQIINAIYSNLHEWFGVVCFDDNYVISEVFSSMLSRYLVVFFKTSGAEYQRVQIQGKINSIGKISNNIYYVVIQNQTDLTVYNYNITNNSIWLEKEILNCLVHDVYYRDNLLYMATDSGLLTYNYISTSLNTISNLNFYEIKYESTNNVLFLNSGKDIWTYQNSGSPSLLYSLNDSIKQMMMFYNK